MVTGGAASLYVAKHYLRLAIEAESRSDDRLARAQFLVAMRHDPTPEAGLAFGQFLADLGQIDDAIRVVQDSWQLAKRRACPTEIAGCCRRLATLFHRAGQSSLAKRFLQRAAAAEMGAWSNDQATLSGEQFLVESQFAARDGDVPRAMALCECALVAARSTDVSAVLRHRARLKSLEGRRHTAARELLTAARLAREAAGDRDYAECLLELGHVLQSLERLPLALRCYKAAARRFACAGKPKLVKAANRWAALTAALERSGGDGRWN